VGSGACLDAVAKTKIPIIAPAGNRKPVIQPVGHPGYESDLRVPNRVTEFGEFELTAAP